jgi:hypothetical protein
MEMLGGLATSRLALSNFVFVSVFISAVAFNIAAWWLFVRAVSSLTRGQKQRAIVAMLMNLVAFFFPILWAFSQVLADTIRWNYVLISCWALCALSSVLGALGSRRVRLPLLMGSFSIVLLYTMIAGGVL